MPKKKKPSAWDHRPVSKISADKADHANKEAKKSGGSTSAGRNMVVARRRRQVKAAPIRAHGISIAKKVVAKVKAKTKKK